MGRADDRKPMDRALKEIVVPELRRLGFGGSYPYFRRVRDGHVDLLSFQFNRHGGSFVAEIAYIGPDGQNLFDPACRTLEPNSLRASHALDRLRLGCDPASKDPSRQSDHWFKFGGLSLSPFGDRYRKRAEEVAARLVDQGVPWWDEMWSRTTAKPA